MGLRRNGYFFGCSWQNDLGTLETARSLGAVVDIQALLPRSGIPTVQTLKPRSESEAPRNQYSTEFGLGAFPLHTDLAHWARPPRYVILRCKRGNPAVLTTLLPASALVSVLGIGVLRRALVRPRRVRVGEVQCLLPLLFGEDTLSGLRWDPLFIVPMNHAGQQVAEVMSTEAWDRSQLVEIVLSEPGDTLILDNWRFLHGRSSVHRAGLDRHLERVYLSSVHT